MYCMYRKIFCILLLIRIVFVFDSSAAVFRMYSSGEKCLLEMHREMLGRNFLVVSRLDSVYENRTYQPGCRWGKVRVVTFRLGGAGKVDVYLPDYRFDERETSLEMRRLLARGKVELPVMNCPVLKESSDQVVIDITGMLKGGQPLFDGEGKEIVRLRGEDDRFYCTVTRELPAIRREWKREGDKMTGMPVTTTFFLLPDVPWQVRERDRRVGFSSVSSDYFKDESTGVRTRHIIRRWALEPRDVQAYERGELTEPREPIVFYLDPTIPACWRPYVVRAVEDWQRAFEAAGFRNAIVARELSGEMVREISTLNGVILYQDSLRGEVVDVNTDPRSGQIVQARVHWSPQILDSLRYEWIARSALWKAGDHLREMEEQITGNLIRITIGQRVGMALGLLPNKFASAWIPVENLRNGVGGMSSSIMGSVMLNTVAQPEDRVGMKDMFPVVGDYDCWAIHWGYRYGEKESLAAWLESMERPEFWWCDKAFSRAVANLENLGDDPVASAEYTLENVKRMFAGKCDTPGWEPWVRHAGEKTGVLYTTVLPVLQQFGGIGIRLEASCAYAPVLFPVGWERQEKAMEFLKREVFSTPRWLMRSVLIKKADIDPVEIITAWQSVVLEFLFETSMSRFALNNIMLGEESLYTADEFLDGMYRAIWVDVEHEDACMKALRLRYLEILGKVLNGYTKSNELVSLQVHLQKLRRRIELVLSGTISGAERESWISYKTKIEDVL